MNRKFYVGDIVQFGDIKEPYTYQYAQVSQVLDKALMVYRMTDILREWPTRIEQSIVDRIGPCSYLPGGTHNQAFKKARQSKSKSSCDVRVLNKVDAD